MSPSTLFTQSEGSISFAPPWATTTSGAFGVAFSSTRAQPLGHLNGAMTSGFETTSMTLTSSQTHPVRFSLLSFAHKWFCLAALAAQTRPAPNVASRSPHRRGCNVLWAVRVSSSPSQGTAQGGGGGWRPGFELAAPHGSCRQPSRHRLQLYDLHAQKP